jgi:hypothetical protein
MRDKGRGVGEWAEWLSEWVPITARATRGFYSCARRCKNGVPWYALYFRQPRYSIESIPYYLAALRLGL